MWTIFQVILNIQPFPGAFHLSEKNFNKHEMQTRLVKLNQTKCFPTAYQSYQHEKAEGPTAQSCFQFVIVVDVAWSTSLLTHFPGTAPSVSHHIHMDAIRSEALLYIHKWI